MHLVGHIQEYEKSWLHSCNRALHYIFLFSHLSSPALATAVRQSRGQDDHSPPPNAEGKNDGLLLQLPHTPSSSAHRQLYFSSSLNPFENLQDLRNNCVECTKLAPCSVKRRAMKTYAAVEVQVHGFFMSRKLCAPAAASLSRRLYGYCEEKDLCPCRESNRNSPGVHSVAYITTKLTELPRLLCTEQKCRANKNTEPIEYL